MESNNLAARAGRWSANNWKKAFFGWFVLAIAALVLGVAIGQKQMADSEAASGESAKAQRILEDAGFKPPATESVLIQNKSERADSPAFQSAIGTVVQTLSTLPNVTNIQNPLVQKGGGGQISADRHSVLVQFDVKGDADDAAGKIQPIMDQIAGVQMKLLGDWNWYMPRWLEWVPSLAADGRPSDEVPETPAITPSP